MHGKRGRIYELPTTKQQRLTGVYHFGGRGDTRLFQGVQIEVFDIRGQLLQAEQWEVTDGLNSQVISLAGWSSGVYILRTTQGVDSQIVRVVKK